jgi:hypothetical protein
MDEKSICVELTSCVISFDLNEELCSGGVRVEINTDVRDHEHVYLSSDKNEQYKTFFVVFCKY